MKSVCVFAVSIQCGFLSCISAAQLAAAGLGVAIVPQRAVDALGGMERFSC